MPVSFISHQLDSLALSFELDDPSGPRQKCPVQVGIKVVRLEGSMAMMQRDRMIEAFTTDASVRVFLMSLKAGGVALNLTAASHVMLMDPWWNPAVEQQARPPLFCVFPRAYARLDPCNLAGSKAETTSKHPSTLSRQSAYTYTTTLGTLESMTRTSLDVPHHALHGSHLYPDCRHRTASTGWGSSSRSM